MAPAIGFALFNLGAPLGLVNAAAGVGLVGSLLSTVAPLALSVGASYLLADRPRAPKPSDGQVEVRQPIPARVFHYGRVKVSGPLAYYGSNDGRLFKLVLISCRQIDGYEAVYIDDLPATIRGDGGVTNKPSVDDSPPEPNIFVDRLVGSSDQLVSSLMLGATGWTSAHRLRGNAYVAMSCKSTSAEVFQSRYPNGEPTIAVLIRGSLLYDPRDGGTRWSDNAGLAILDYLTHEDGYDIPLARLDLDSFRAFANLCDEPVPLANGGTEPRYRVAMSVSLGQARTEVLARLRAACDAQLYATRDGRIAIRGGRYEQPRVTIDTDAGQVLEFNFEPPDAMSRYNELAIQYLDPALGYVEAEGTPWTHDADFARTGVLKTQQLDLTHVPSHSQARRLAKILMARENCDKMAEALVDIDGLNCFGERIIRFKNPEIDVDQDFWLEGGPEFEAFTVTRLKMRSANAASYQWTPAEEGQSTAIPPDTTPDLGLDPPALTVTQGPNLTIIATWTASAALNRGYHVQYRNDLDGPYVDMTVSDFRNSAVSSAVSSGRYFVRIRTNAGPQALGPWSADYPITIEQRGTEVVRNGDNEAALMSGPGAHLQYGITRNRTNERAATGSFSLKASHATSDSEAHYLLIDGLKSGNSYRIAVDVYVPSGGIETARLFDAYDGSWFGAASTVKGAWVRLTSTRAAKSSAWGVGIGNHVNEAKGGQSFFLDNLSIEELP